MADGGPQRMRCHHLLRHFEAPICRLKIRFELSHRLLIPTFVILATDEPNIVDKDQCHLSQTILPFHVSRSQFVALIVYAIICRGNHRFSVASFVRPGGSWGDRMEQEFMEEHEMTNGNLVRVGNLAARNPSGRRCELPLGKTMVCGNARHREDRQPDSEVVSGGARSHDVWLIRSGILRLQRYAYGPPPDPAAVFSRRDRRLRRGVP